MKRSHSEFDASRETTSPWIVAQLGAREHYAIPRALQSAGEQVRLVTDFWAPQSILSWLSGRLRDRTHPGIASKAVTAFSTSSLQFETVSRLRRLRGWPLIEARNAWFDQCTAVEIGRSNVSNGTLFAYSYAARRTLAVARERGLRTVLGQIDPGPVEWRLVRERRKEAGLPPEPEPSSDYWKSWRNECQLADALVANSDWSREALIEDGISPGKIHVVPLAYEGTTPNSVAKPPGVTAFTAVRPLRVLFLGQIIVRKGLLEVLDAIDRLAGQPVMWTFAGGGEAALLEQLRRRPQTRVLGPVRRQEAGLHYGEADIFLLPTHSDGFAITQLEAAAHGLPIVASKHCGKVVENGVNGIILERVTGEAISEAVSSLLNNPRRLADFRTEQQRRPLRKLVHLAADLAQVGQGISRPNSVSITQIHVDC